MACAVSALLGLAAGWLAGFARGDIQFERTVALAAGIPSPQAPAPWLEQFEAMDRLARQARPDLSRPQRQWRVLLLLRAAYRWGVDPGLVMSVALKESALREDAVSPRGAVGIMQLMPATARAYGADPYDVEQNIEAGVRYLADLLRRYRGELHLALAAYNAGPSRVGTAVPDIPETREYVRRVVEAYRSR